MFKVQKMFKVHNKDTRTRPMTSFWCLFCWLWTYFTPCSSISIVEHVIGDSGWVNCTSCHYTQAAFTCSKLTIETLEQGMKYVQRTWNCRLGKAFRPNFLVRKFSVNGQLVQIVRRFTRKSAETVSLWKL